MKEVTLKTQGYPGFLSNFENGAKQLEAQLKNGVAKKKCVPGTQDTTKFPYIWGSDVGRILGTRQMILFLLLFGKLKRVIV